MHGHLGSLMYLRRQAPHAAETFKRVWHLDSTAIALYVLLCCLWGAILYTLLGAIGT